MMFDDFEKYFKELSPDAFKRRIPIILYRKGGDRTDWTTPGGQVFAPVSTIVMIGCVEWTGASATSGDVVQAFPVHYYGEPLIFIQPRVTTPSGAFLMAYAISAGDAVEIYWKSDVAVTMARFAWIAFGGQLVSP